jgi:hypothetical protein
MSPAEVVDIYAGRWPIEMCFREVKRDVEAKSPKDKGPERAAGCRSGCMASSGSGISRSAGAARASR